MTTNGNGNGNADNGNGHSKLAKEWQFDPRWEGVTRPYTHADVEQLRGSVRIETLPALEIEAFLKNF